MSQFGLVQISFSDTACESEAFCKITVYCAKEHSINNMFQLETQLSVVGGSQAETFYDVLLISQLELKLIEQSTML